MQPRKLLVEEQWRFKTWKCKSDLKNAQNSKWYAEFTNYKLRFGAEYTSRWDQEAGFGLRENKRAWRPGAQRELEKAQTGTGEPEGCHRSQWRIQQKFGRAESCSWLRLWQSRHAGQRCAQRDPARRPDSPYPGGKQGVGRRAVLIRSKDERADWISSSLTTTKSTSGAVEASATGELGASEAAPARIEVQKGPSESASRAQREYSCRLPRPPNTNTREAIPALFLWVDWSQ
jgi:hypothetical protein